MIIKVSQPKKSKQSGIKASDPKYKTLAEIRKTGSGTVTYKFADETFQRQPINIEVFKDDKDRVRPIHKVMEIFETSMNDRNAISFELN